MTQASIEDRVAERERESRPGVRCSVCEFVDARPDAEVWDRLITGSAKVRAIFDVMVEEGYHGVDAQNVARCRSKGHRR